MNTPSRHHFRLQRVLWVFGAWLGVAGIALAGIEPTPFIDWSTGWQLQGRGARGDDPRVIFGFDPQPEPPKQFTQDRDLSQPDAPLITNRGDFEAGSAFDVVLAIGLPAVQLSVVPDRDGDYPPDPIRTLLFHAFAPGEIVPCFDILLEFLSASGGVLDGVSAVAFNPQPEPPGALFGPDSTAALSFTFTSFSDVSVRLRVFDADGNAIVFNSVPEPAALALLLTGMAFLPGLSRRRARI